MEKDYAFFRSNMIDHKQIMNLQSALQLIEPSVSAVSIANGLTPVVVVVHTYSDINDDIRTSIQNCIDETRWTLTEE
jgi:hypothetical protein